MTRMAKQVCTAGVKAEQHNEGRVNVAAKTIHYAPNGWFKTGAGKTEWFKDHKLGPEMVVVPAGEFMMGSPESELGRWDNEGPLHSVNFARPFCVGRHAVTRGQFAAFVAETTYKMEGGAQSLDRHRMEARSELVMAQSRLPSGRRVIRWYASTGTMHSAYARGYRRSQGKPIVCSARLSGNTLPAPERRRRIWWGSSITPAKPTTTAIRAFRLEAKCGSRPCLSATSRLTCGVFTMCMAMSGSGARTFGTKTTMARLRMARLGLMAATPVAVLSVAAPGSSFASSSAPPTGIDIQPIIEARMLASALAGRFPREFSPWNSRQGSYAAQSIGAALGGDLLIDEQVKTMRTKSARANTSPINWFFI